MFNDHLSNEMAKEYIERREKEVETYSLHKRLGYGGNSTALWVFVLIIVIALVALGLLF